MRQVHQKPIFIQGPQDYPGRGIRRIQLEAPDAIVDYGTEYFVEILGFGESGVRLLVAHLHIPVLVHTQLCG